MTKILIEGVLALIDGSVTLKVKVFFSLLDLKQTYGQLFAFG